MAKRKHREQSPIENDSSSNVNDKNTPFGIDPMQLMGLLGGNFDMNNIGNMLASMNTNGFNLGNLNSIAQMMGLNLDNNLFQGNMNSGQGNMSGSQSNVNKNTYSDVKEYSNNNNNNNSGSSSTNSKNTENSNVERNVKKSSVNNRNIKDNDANLEFLIAIRSYAHPDRIKFIDKIIEAYRNGDFKEI